VLHGHAELRRFFAEGTRRRPNELVRWYRTGACLCDGRTLFWEYPRDMPDGEQVDIAEVMEIAPANNARNGRRAPTAFRVAHPSPPRVRLL